MSAATILAAGLTGLLAAVCGSQHIANAQGLFQDSGRVSPGLSQGFDNDDSGQFLDTFKIKPLAQPDVDTERDDAPAPAAAPAQPSPPVAPRKAESGAAGPATPARSHDPVELYLSALAELNFGRILQAEQLLQKVIASSPSSDIAELARRRLEDLVRSRSKSGGSIATDATTPSRTPPPAIRPDIEMKSKVAAPQRSSRDLAIEQAFRNEVGDRVFFGPGSAELGARAKSAIASQARWLLKRPEIDARIEGHADEPGSIVQNMELSRVRAAAVRDRLIAEGLDAERVQTLAFGQDRPVATCDGPECRAQNSRVVTVVYVSRRAIGQRRKGALSSGAPERLPVAARDASSQAEIDALRVPR